MIHGYILDRLDDDKDKESLPPAIFGSGMTSQRVRDNLIGGIRNKDFFWFVVHRIISLSVRPFSW